MSNLLAISLGDVTGVGPEITLKALASELAADETRYLIVGDTDCVRHWNEFLDLHLDFTPYTGPSTPGRILLLQPSAALPVGLPPGAPVAAQAALAWIETGARLCLRNEAQALITAPVSKEAILRSGTPGFVGQTEFLAQLAGGSKNIMMLLGPDDRDNWLRVALATTHLPLKAVPGQLTREKVQLAIELTAAACRDLGLARARVGVCGLNPHAGEGGHLGDEELTIVGPAVLAAQQLGLDAVGPLAADTLFHRAWRGEFDAVVAMYHDQGLAPLKMVAFDRGVNWTLGLPFIRTSPDHGTAYDIAGRGQANPSSMVAALRLAKRLAKQRKSSIFAG